MGQGTAEGAAQEGAQGDELRRDFFVRACDIVFTQMSSVCGQG